MVDLERFFGPNAGYALELYERYRQNPASVDAATRAIFDKLPPEATEDLKSNNNSSGPQTTSNGTTSLAPVGAASQVDPASAQGQSLPPVPAQANGAAAQIQIPHVVAAVTLASAIRSRGHLGAHLDPLGIPPLGDPALLPETHGISDEDLMHLPPNVIGGHAASGAPNAYEAVKRLRAMYSGHISYEFDQVKSPDERVWLRDAVGGALYQQPRKPTSSRTLLKMLTQVEAFERYLHQTFSGQKRFSLEGNDTLVPMLEELVGLAVASGSKEVIIGMAHRGRLNVLAHTLKKPYAAILAEFMHTKGGDDTPLLEKDAGKGWSGDVKYHLGAEKILLESQLKIILSPNPSHLEFVNPVIQGIARASQETRDKAGLPAQDINRTLPIVIHGDAAFPAEGIVAETLNLWNLRGYRVGGTIHIIANNQIGFTTEPEDGRSTHFASDLAKGFEVPIIHVNADDPDACLTAIRLSKAYRDRFHKDILVDLVGYRRWGHNEGDEPAFTQPQMYEVIRTHPTVREIYAQLLVNQGLIREGEAEAMLKEAYAELEQAKNEAGSVKPHAAPTETGFGEHDFSQRVTPASVSEADLLAYNQALLEWPENFAPNPKLARLLQRRAQTISQPNTIDWGQAEELAFASILADGKPIRLTGQDSERGTFSHRHAVLHDQTSGKTFTPLQHLPQAYAPFSIYNSPISEAAVLGFEYGYSVRGKDSLVLWEAQFGDFANVAQVIIDQFISTGRTKWGQKSGLVLLLPHGLEGQGPEHSSARLERYLALSAGENWRVANCSTAAQYFHLLRQQAAEIGHEPRPLVLMSPKSLLRHPQSAASLSELVNGTFQPVLNDAVAQARPDQIRRIVLCSGKIGIDLLSHPNRAQAEDVAIVRVEQLYPFPVVELSDLLTSYPNMREVVWVQEEPQNMGAWRYMYSRLQKIIGQDRQLNSITRPEQSSPATGFMDTYLMEQEQIISGAFRSPVKELGGKHGR